MSSNFFDKNHCSPEGGTDFSCFSEDEIRKLASGVNKLSKKNKKIEKIEVRNRSVEDIYRDIEDRIKSNSNCDKEACILSLEDLIKVPGMEKLKEKVKIEQPEEWKRDVKNNRWVSNWEIDDILFREDDRNKHFYYWGAYPIDFDDCKVSPLCKFSLRRHLKDQHNKVGMVFNTGDSDSDGQHWVSMVLDTCGNKTMGVNPCVYYFDSYGREPVDKVQRLIDKILEQAAKMKIVMEVKHNPKRFQVSGYECGMYAIHFIKEMIKGKMFEDILKSGFMNDQTMVKLRDADMGGYLLGHHVMKGGRLTKKKSKKDEKKSVKKKKKMKGGKIDVRVNRKSRFTRKRKLKKEKKTNKIRRN
jgi:hypothetical protein